MELSETIKHRLYMPPLKKYEVYGRFPWKFVIQMLLVLFTTCQIIFIVNRSTTYAYNQYTLWNKIFLNKDVQGSDTTITNSYNIFSANSLTNFIQESVDKYYDINSETIDDYKYHYTDSGLKKAPKLLVEYFDNDKALGLGYLFEYSLLSNDLGPFSLDGVQDFLGEVKKFEIKFGFIHTLDKYINLASDCYQWELTQEYDFTYHGVVGTSLGTKRLNCGGAKRNITRNYLWIDLIVIILAIASLGTIVNYFHMRIEILKEISGITSGINSAWESLGIKEKLKLFNFWTIISFTGNLFQLFGAFSSIFEPSSEMKVNEILMGFGCFFAWVGVVRFLDNRSHSYTIAKTVTRSSPIIGRYIIGVVPFFMGYTFVAMCVFWQTGIYPSTSMGMIANYAVVNGDSVYAFGLAEYQEHLFIGQLYYYSFVVFFIW